ncbi:PREDICTED: cilia- and flagella-associated protein 43 [Nicrophorus vespilloides]|uniref:Cilia- and flagella-associated protein 43 n=1 Tax=Nicrophorus vespilloides TaxID=110193 RepID=A0ABM1M433_NICVS|nr:PREDICTED: cilia- and flagella-associated protein 43 [Nicrophorus vespilloides]
MSDADVPLSKSQTEWVKLGKVRHLYFIGKEICCFYGGCHILFVHVVSGQQRLLRVNDSEIGEGVRCFAGHRSLPFFAYAEKCKKPKIKVLSYPEFKIISTMHDDNCEQYIRTVFTETELMIALTGFPSCTMVVYKWRTGEYVASASTDLIYSKQILRSNFGCPVRLFHVIKYTTQVYVWEVSMCGRKCIMNSEKISHRDPLNMKGITSSHWTTDGALIVCDTKGNIYTLSTDYKLDEIIHWDEDGPNTATFCWHKNGALIQGCTGEIRHYVKTGDWVLNWSVHTPLSIKKFNGREHLVCITQINDVRLFNEQTKDFDKVCGDSSRISDFAIIFPRGKTFVTLSHQRKLNLWNIATGLLLNRIKFEGEKLVEIASNPKYPYVAVTNNLGMLRLYSALEDTLELMTSFQLCRQPLNVVKFFEDSKIIVTGNMDTGELFVIEGVPGSKFNIIGNVSADAQLADLILVGSKACIRLFTIVITSNMFCAGNNITRFCITKAGTTVKTYELEHPERLYTRLYVSLDPQKRDRIFYATPMDNKNLHELETKRADTHARIINRIPSGHWMKRICYYFTEQYILTYGYDGLIMVRPANDMTQILYTLMPHHRIDCGIKRAAATPDLKYVISLGFDNILVGTSVTDIKVNEEYEAKVELLMQEYTEMFSKPTIGFIPIGILEGKAWSEYYELMRIEGERIKYEKERNSILKEFQRIKTAVCDLLTQNSEGPENELLDLQDFNLDLNLKEEKIKASKEKCDNTKMYLENLIAEETRVSKLIKERFWDKISVQKRNMWAIFGFFDVNSYAIPPADGIKQENLVKIQKNREIEELLASDTFQPWKCITEEELNEKLNVNPHLNMNKEQSFINLEDDEEEEEENEELIERQNAEFETYTALCGSTIHTFVDLDPGHYTQPELQSFYQHYWDLYMSMNEQQKLMEFFNQKFESMSQTKIHEMSSIMEKNARLRYLLDELNYFSKNKLSIIIFDPEWMQDENPEMLTKVDSSEVSITPYISPSEQDLLDAEAAEAERIRLLRLADDFKERALMKMMNGVLEVRWEEELRKEVPKPKCMLEKQPEKYNVDDLKDIKDYEAAVVFLASERERYRVILQTEYTKLSSQLRDNVKKFNDRLQELMILKIQVESANTNEMLRANRLRQWEIKRNLMDKEDNDIMKLISQNQSTTNSLSSLVASLKEFKMEIRSNLEMLQSKEKFLDKNFRKDFQDVSTAVFEMLVKLYKKRPKINLRTIGSTCVLNVTSQCVVNHTRSILLLPEAIEYLNSLDFLDKFVGLPLVIDEHNYSVLCRHRRLKIESEIKIRASAMELTEAESTIDMFEKRYIKSRDLHSILIKKLEDLREKKFQHSLNIELQIVLKEGFVEIPRTGSMDDFKDALIISRADVEHINDVIIDAGKKKIKAMKNAMCFKREIMLKEWEHKKKKMEIEDLHYKLADIKSVKLTKVLQDFLKSKARGESADKLLSFEHEVELAKLKYVKMINEHKQKIKEIEGKLVQLEIENKKIDKQIKKVNVDVCDYQLHFDKNLEKKEKEFLEMKINAYLKRAKLVSQIQSNHNEILVLQAELEILRLKTFPVLDYKIDE